MERLLKKRDGVKYQVDCIYDYVRSISTEDGEVKTTAKILASKQAALNAYEEKYDQYFEDLLEESTVDQLEEIHLSYKLFQDKCTGTEEIIEIIQDNFFCEGAAKSSADNTASLDSTLLQAVKEIVTNQVESLQRITAQQQKSFEDLLSSSKSVSSSEAKLPQLELKSFYGGYEQWVEFFDSFKCAVDSKPNLAPVQKLQYLKSCLKGEAATLVRNLNLNDANYAVALSLLKGRYENVKNIREAHFDAIFNVSSVSKKSAYNLRKLINNVNENLQALRNLDEPINQWDSWIVYFLKKKLDNETRFEWEKHTASNVNPSYKEMYDFIRDHAYALEASEEKSKRVNKPNQLSSASTATASSKCFNVTQSEVCFLCKGDHRLAYCPEYTCLDSRQRKAKVLSLKLCVNCFSRQHFVNQCPKPASCKTCRKKHHPTLHYDDIPKHGVEASIDRSDNFVVASTSNVSTCVDQPAIFCKEVLLATAIVNVYTEDGDQVLCRALLDPGSQSSFITQGCVQRLRLKTSINGGVNVSGIGGVCNGTVKRNVVLRLSPVSSSSCVLVNALVIDRIASTIPRRSISGTDWPQLDSLELADPHFLTPGPIDILLGGDIYARLMVGDVGVLKRPDGEMLAQLSIFGWVVTGSIASPCLNVNSDSTLTHLVQTDDLLKRFWEIEEIPSATNLSLEEKRCEQHFKATTYREDGRYVVSLPFKADCSLGESRSVALKRLEQTERRLTRDPGLKESYSAAMKDYFDQGHAEKVPDEELNADQVYYMPHHAVIRESSSTTKVRVVFDASAKTSNGVSLNECLMVGPKVQDDLLDILTRFRIHPVAFSADIAKMYRQVSLHPKDRNFHRFLWRTEETQKVEEYRMTTVTFGVASSAYQAQRVLLELVNDEEGKYPLAEPIVRRDMYMDDCLSGAPDAETAVRTRQELVNLMKEGGFDLRKWASSNTEVLKGLSPELCEVNLEFDLDLEHSEQTVKTLGMNLSLNKDEFLFKVEPMEGLSGPGPITKRIFLSDASKVFDPLGLLAPVLVIAKILFQQMWLSGIKWDDPLPAEIMRVWSNWRSELLRLQELRLPRCVIAKEDKVARYELHGFCDASESAYAAAVYMCTRTVNDKAVVNLISAKTKVAPLKRISVPRLELCGAVLLARLIARIQKAFYFLKVFLYCWTDSLVALSWIHGEPSRWKTFVGNRVSEIQELVNPSQWSYCPSTENPADCASRGIQPAEILSHSLWYNGPIWLKDPDTWPTQPSVFATNESSMEQKKNTTTLINVVKPSTGMIFSLLPYSSFVKVIRVLAWCRRWLLKHNKVVTAGPLTKEELKGSLTLLIKEAQDQAYAVEIDCLMKGKVIPNRSKIVSLNAFLDEHKVLRVGGRLNLASLPYDQKQFCCQRSMDLLN